MIKKQILATVAYEIDIDATTYGAETWEEMLEVLAELQTLITEYGYAEIRFYE